MKAQVVLAVLLSLAILVGIVGCCEDDKEPITPAPVDVSGIKASNGNRQVILTWQLVENAVSYIIERSDKRDGTYREIGSKNNLTFVDTDVTNGTTYYYKIISRSSDGIENDKVATFPWKYVDEPELWVSDEEHGLNLGYSETSKTIEVANTGTGELTWNATVDKDWVSLDKTSATISTEKSIVRVTVDRSELNPGEHQATITITSKQTEGDEPKISVLVSKKSEPTPVVKPEDLDFGETAKQMSFTIDNLGTGTLSWSIEVDQNWVIVEPGSGNSTPAEINVEVDRENLLLKESYFATITVKFTVEPNSTDVPDKFVQLTMKIPPKLEVVTKELDFGEDLDALPATIKNAGGGELNWWLSTEDEWIIVHEGENKTGAGEEYTFTIQVERDNFPPDEHHGTIIVASANGDKAEIPVTMKVKCMPILAVEPSEVNFRDAEVLPLTIKNIGTCELTWEASVDKPWIALSSYDGAAPETVKVEINRNEVPPESYTGNINIKSQSNGDEKNIPVTVPPPEIAVYPQFLNFGEATMNERLTIENTGEGLLIWEIEAPAWITCQPPNGSTKPGEEFEVIVEVDRTGLELGNHDGAIEIESNGGEKNVTVKVTKTCIVNGVVIDSRSGRQISGADIISSEGTLTQTDSRGQFSLSIKSSGMYKISVSMRNYIGSEKEIVVDQMGNPISLEILLKPLPRVLVTLRDAAMPFKSPMQIAITPDDVFVYVTNSDDGTVSVIDVFTDRIRRKIHVGDEPMGIAANPNLSVREVYVANSGSDNVSVIDTTTNAEIAKIPAGRFPVDLVVSSDGRTLYVTNRYDKNISIVDVEKRQQIETVKLGAVPEGITLTPDDIYLYISNFQDNTVSVIDVRTKTPVNGPIKVGAEPMDITVSKNDKYVYVVNRLDGSFSIIDVFSNVALPPIEINNGQGASGIVATTEIDGSDVVLVTNSFESNVAAIDISTRQSAVDVIPVGSAPLGIAATSDGRKIYIANSGDDSVSVLGY